MVFSFSKMRVGTSPSTLSWSGESCGVWGLELLLLTRAERKALSSSKEAFTARAIVEYTFVTGTLIGIVHLRSIFSYRFDR